ncbi:ankyrin repeat-containing domain protein [Verticillium dahliae]|uniref:Ankyrin repeat protein n=1 Tax=Verticillium dahliae TaxID=27337 RepID=A0AA45AN66_VERDA|nr:hypothetical protein VdG2_01367 [Verticillium dahliae VDG2]KAH6706726.1 ankyrin repeat-containing domain protein [Verticillium dahliae]PNH33205.1 hypothetical protein BJF96_g3614 [Verticillium dahliae]PNH54882.1 hypothetical protein VD0003_g2660 [Verticillium dahliae]
MDHHNSPSVDLLVENLSGVQDLVKSTHQTLLSRQDHLNLPVKTFLRAASGKLHTALMLIEDLRNPSQNHSESPGNPGWTADLAHVEACKQALSGWQVSTQQPAQDVLKTLQALCIHLDIAQQAQTFVAFVKCLSVQFQEHPDRASIPVQGPQTEQESADSLEEVKASLDLILSSKFDQKVGCLYDYRQLVLRRNTDFPSYSKGCITWLGYAEQYWPQLGDRILRLFHAKKTCNFQHWILEYCQQSYPEIYGLGTSATPERSLLVLISTIIESSVSPLHVAAALGLAQVCKHLIGQNLDENRQSPLGTPYYCALIGPMALLAQKDSPVNMVQWPCPSIAQMDTLYAFENSMCWTDVESDSVLAPLSLPNLIFLVCLRLGSTELYQHFFSLEHLESLPEVIMDASYTQVPWGAPDSERAKAFLSTTLPYLFDTVLPEFEEVHASEVLNGLWDVMNKMCLDMTVGKARTQVALIEDYEFLDIARRALRHYEEPVVLRLIQDPRWKPDAIRTSDGSPILHSLVVDDSIDMIEAVVDSGADIHIRDDEGQTPVMRCESVSTLAFLVSHGARLDDVDDQGQNIWHICAANSDRGMLEWLVEHDPHMKTSLGVCMRGGRTPTAQAMIHVLFELTKVDPDGPTDIWGEALHRRAEFCLDKLLSFCKTEPSYLQASDYSLIHVAAEWGRMGPMEACLQSGNVKMDALDGNGNSALHLINFAADSEAVCFLQKQCASAPIQNNKGYTPAETIFFNFDRAFSALSLDSCLSSHPASSTHLQFEAYLLLLTPEVLSSEDAAGRQLWERFIVDIVHGWSTRVAGGRRANRRAFPSLLCAAACLVAKGALASWRKCAGADADPLFGIKESEHWKSDRYWRTCVQKIEAEVNDDSGCFPGSGLKRSRSASDAGTRRANTNGGGRQRTPQSGRPRHGSRQEDLED